MKKQKHSPNFEKEVIVLFEKIMAKHVTTGELRDHYRKDFKKLLMDFAKYNYIKGSNDAHEIFTKK